MITDYHMSIIQFLKRVFMPQALEVPKPPLSFSVEAPLALNAHFSSIQFYLHSAFFIGGFRKAAFLGAQIAGLLQRKKATGISSSISLSDVEAIRECSYNTVPFYKCLSHVCMCCQAPMWHFSHVVPRGFEMSEKKTRLISDKTVCELRWPSG